MRTIYVWVWVCEMGLQRAGVDHGAIDRERERERERERPTAHADSPDLAASSQAQTASFHRRVQSPKGVIDWVVGDIMVLQRRPNSCIVLEAVQPALPPADARAYATVDGTRVHDVCRVEASRPTLVATPPSIQASSGSTSSSWTLDDLAGFV